MYEDFSKPELEKRDALAVTLYSEHYEALLFYAIELCRRFRLHVTLAEDALQELFLKVMTDPQTVSIGYKEKGYPFLCVMVRNCLVDFYRKGKSLQRVHDITGEQMPHISRFDLFYLSPETRIEELLLEMRRMLPDLYFRAIELYAMGYILREIAEMMGISEAKAFRLVDRARKILFNHYSQFN